jgi:hypothetical protein
VQAVGGVRRTGHLGQGDRIGSGDGVRRLGVAEATVGLLANYIQGVPVLGVDFPADPEIPGVTDHCFGAKGAAFFEVPAM